MFWAGNRVTRLCCLMIRLGWVFLAGWVGSRCSYCLVLSFLPSFLFPSLLALFPPLPPLTLPSTSFALCRVISQVSQVGFPFCCLFLLCNRSLQAPLGLQDAQTPFRSPFSGLQDSQTPFRSPFLGLQDSQTPLGPATLSDPI